MTSKMMSCQGYVASTRLLLNNNQVLVLQRHVLHASIVPIVALYNKLLNVQAREGVQLNWNDAKIHDYYTFVIWCIRNCAHVDGHFRLWQSYDNIRLPRIPIVFMNTSCWHWFALEISCTTRFKTDVDYYHHVHYIKHHSLGFHYEHGCNKSTLERGENPPSHSRRYKIFCHPKESFSNWKK